MKVKGNPMETTTKPAGKAIPACPHLPEAPKWMSYRDLRPGKPENPSHLFGTACRYAQFLWLRGLPARSLLALCRALYLHPEGLPPGARQPYAAFVWILRNAHHGGFLGNPRVSFFHQAVRTSPERYLQRERATALWHLTVKIRPDLSPDPEEWSSPPCPAKLSGFLDDRGLPKEGRVFLNLLQEPVSESPSREGGP